MSDEAGAGANVGFAAKVSGAPVRDEVLQLDLYIHTTLYGIKPGLPYGASLQCVEGEAAGEAPSCGPSELVGPTADGVAASMFWVPTNLSAQRKMPGCALAPVPSTLLPAPCSLRLVPCALLPAPCSQHLAHSTFAHSTLLTRFPAHRSIAAACRL